MLTFADEDKYTGGLANFKKVTGGDAIRCEIKKKQAFDFLFLGMVMLASNYPIFSGDTSSGIYRRLLMVPFNIIIPPHKRRDLEKEFEPELDALTNYVLTIPDEIVTQTLRQSVDQAPEVIDRTWDWRMRQDSVAAWLNECVIHDPNACERVGNDKDDVETLFGSYYRYCDQTGSRAKGSREFSPALLELVNNDPALNWGIEKKRVTGGFMIRGLRLRRAGDENQPYCLEALANAGSNANVESVPDVGSNVGSNVGSESLPEAGYVGYVGLEDLTEKNASQNNAIELIEPISEKIPENNRSSYIPCINESEQAIQPYTSTLHMQDNDPTQLPDHVVQMAVDRMAAIDSIESFQEFHDRYQRCSDPQQKKVIEAFTLQVDDEQQARFYKFWEAFWVYLLS
ncbi:MAG: hypothetical protein HC899_38310, partial [Leptolyngbyaceae cyanobacterium SM1_4_3]|nr:hypothetical protein [Leptolyngbyaceae cyanobacterium SM1_4_3]